MRIPRWLLEAKDKRVSVGKLGLICTVRDKMQRYGLGAVSQAKGYSETNLEGAATRRGLKRVSPFVYDEVKDAALRATHYYLRADYQGYFTHPTFLGRVVARLGRWL